MKINFRAIVEADYAFLRRLHNAALRKYVEETWGWNEDWQERNFKANFNPDDGVIIVCENVDVGFFWKIEKENEILLASVRIMPEYQNKGIGTKIIKDFLASANKNVRLQVLKVNPARNLYARLGFVIKDETDTHFIMERKSTND